jgi:subtilase family serine protease
MPSRKATHRLRHLSRRIRQKFQRREAASSRRQTLRRSCFEMLEPRQMMAADLKIISHETPSEAIMGQTLPVRFTIKNIGDTATNASWSDYVSLSNTDGGSFNDQILEIRPPSTPALSLAPGQEHPIELDVFFRGRDFGSTDDLIGDVFLVLRTDGFNNLSESDEQNNRISVPIHVSAPDLVVSNATAPTTATLGGTIAASFRVTNSSAVNAPAEWADGFYLSEDDKFQAFQDTQVRSFQRGNLAAGASYDINDTSVVLPSTAQGSKFLLFVSDGGLSQTETNEENNVFAKPITVSGPDLVVLSATAPSEAEPGSQIDISWTVKNQGDMPANFDWIDTVAVSQFDDGFALENLESRDITTQSPLAPGATYTLNSQVTLPAGNRGLYYLHFTTDDSFAQNETADGNNRRVLPIDLGRPDLVVTQIDVPPDVHVGEEFQITYTVKNQGRAALEQSFWIDAINFSTDDVLDDTDTAVSAVSVEPDQPLQPGETYSFTQNVTLNDGRQTHVIIESDGNNFVDETNEQNNKLAKKLNVEAPDLTILNPVLPSSATLGDTFHVSATVKNVGGAATTTFWNDALYISSNNTFDNDDRRVTLLPGPGVLLAESEQYSIDEDVVLPLSSAAGNLFLLLVTDPHGAQAEEDETNNVFAQAIQIGGPDLSMNVTQSPATAIIGETIHVDFSVTNNSDVAAAATLNDYIYLSDDNQFDFQDRFLFIPNNSTHQGLAAHDSYNGNFDFQIPNSAEPGDKFLLFFADGDRVQGELSETNNIVARPITLSGPDLSIRTATAPEGVKPGDTIPMSCICRPTRVSIRKPIG